MTYLTTYSVDTKKNAAGKWPVRDPEKIRVATTDTRAEGLALAYDLNELRQLRVLLAWECGQIAESQACALLQGTPEKLAAWRDTCLRRGLK